MFSGSRIRAAYGERGGIRECGPDGNGEEELKSLNSAMVCYARGHADRSRG